MKDGSGRPSSRTALAIVVLVAQLGAVAWARFTPARYFAWAPYDVVNLYTLDVRIDGRPLGDDEVEARYRLPGFGRDNRSIRHVMDAVRQYEQTYGTNDDAEVVLRYTVNGRAEEEWRWPPP